jgi:AcrR family transcriptional regulator
MRTELKRGEAREAIVRVACELFYTQGYNATGIQQIIDQAGVSKGTFYTHFTSKDELGLEYMRRRHNQESTNLKQGLAAFNIGKERYLAFNSLMRQWMMETQFRGCAFSNMSAEVTDGNSPIRKEAKFHYESFRAIIRDLVEDLIKSDARYKKYGVKDLTDNVMLVSIGAMLNASIYQDVWPYDEAEKAIRKLIGEA